MSDQKKYTFPRADPLNAEMRKAIDPWKGGGLTNWTADERRLWATINTLEAERDQALADARVLAAEVRARRLNTEWACYQDDPDALDVYEWMIEAQHATDASGALERNKP